LATGLVPIFATPFAALEIPHSPGLNEELLALFAARATPAYQDPRLRPNPLCFRSRDDLLDWPDAPLRALGSPLLATVAAGVAAANLYTEAQFDALRMQARASFLIVRQNGCVFAASYPLTSWCALYCVSAPPPVPERADSGVLRLYETRLANMFLDAGNWRLRPPFSHGHHLWQPVAGHMALFPATQLHEVTLNRSAAPLVLVQVRARFASAEQDDLPPW
jgi:hypothetical protein